MKISRRPRRRDVAIRHAPTCPECGQPGRHFIRFSRPTSFQGLFDNPPSAFWTCAKFYGPDGRRID